VPWAYVIMLIVVQYTIPLIDLVSYGKKGPSKAVPEGVGRACGGFWKRPGAEIVETSWLPNQTNKKTTNLILRQLNGNSMAKSTLHLQHGQIFRGFKHHPSKRLKTGTPDLLNQASEMMKT